jgi:hypothetical protein
MKWQVDKMASWQSDIDLKMAHLQSNKLTKCFQSKKLTKGYIDKVTILQNGKFESNKLTKL